MAPVARPASAPTIRWCGSRGKPRSRPRPISPASRPAAAGIDAELVPGILPVPNVATTRRFAASCGATIPVWMDRLFEGLDNLPAARQLVAATVAAELCGQLYAGGVRQFHFYTLNRAELAYAICHLLGLRPREEGVQMLHRRRS